MSRVQILDTAVCFLVGTHELKKAINQLLSLQKVQIGLFFGGWGVLLYQNFHHVRFDMKSFYSGRGNAQIETHAIMTITKTQVMDCYFLLVPYNPLQSDT